MTVQIRTDRDKNWMEKEKVIEKCAAPWAYKVMKENGWIVKRNRQHLMLTGEQFVVKCLHDDDLSNQSILGIPPVSTGNIEHSSPFEIDNSRKS